MNDSPSYIIAMLRSQGKAHLFRKENTQALRRTVRHMYPNLDDRKMESVVRLSRKYRDIHTPLEKKLIDLPPFIKLPDTI